MVAVRMVREGWEGLFVTGLLPTHGTLATSSLVLDSGNTPAEPPVTRGIPPEATAVTYRAAGVAMREAMASVLGPRGAGRCDYWDAFLLSGVTMPERPLLDTIGGVFSSHDGRGAHVLSVYRGGLPGEAALS